MMPRKRTEFHRGGWCSAKPRGKNAFTRESANITRLLMWNRRYETKSRWESHDVIRNPAMPPLIHNGRKPR